MSDISIKKINSSHSSPGEHGQKHLSSGNSLSMRMWENESPAERKEEATREYEAVGYVLKGKAELRCEGQTVILSAGDSWVLPKGASHRYKIIELFRL
ncbi:MAG: cupin domain-containing protein [Candidatus Obscuribacterales bacterium]|nr:cupin domain-containing protein [Candidatus Obscuribacterales bacterium]